jgi:hypothetical protein
MLNRADTGPPQRLSFEAWRIRIQTSSSKEHLLLVVGAYLGIWTNDELKHIGLTRASIGSIDDLKRLAIELADANVNFRGSPHERLWLRDLALVVSTAAARSRHLGMVGADGGRP